MTLKEEEAEDWTKREVACAPSRGGAEGDEGQRLGGRERRSLGDRGHKGRKDDGRRVRGSG